MKTVALKYPSIVLSADITGDLKWFLTVSDFMSVMRRPFRWQMPDRLYHDACTLSLAGFDEKICELVIRARCEGFLKCIPDAEFIKAARKASENCPCLVPRQARIKFTPIKKTTHEEYSNGS